jgi:CarD family transcriptional regulator, regulator of rRNA transcription
VGSPAAVVVSCGYSPKVKLAVGDVVVYGTHGIGRVAAREERVYSGIAGEVVVVELGDGLTVTLPLTRAREHLRPPATEADIRRVRSALREDPVLGSGPWLTRRRETLEKLAGGRLVQLAEVVSEGAERERIRRADGKRPTLSLGERELFERARKLLSDEIALTLGLQHAAADGWIDEQLARPA